MDHEGLKVRPFRIIPCDLGHDFGEELGNQIRDALNESDQWQLYSETEGTRPGGVLQGQLTTVTQPFEVHLELFRDGIAIFTLIDNATSYKNFDSFDPGETLRARREAHDAILNHEHEISDDLDRELSRLRGFFDPDEKRFSASPDWDKGGLSYVFSFYFINADINSVEKEIVQDKLVFLIFAEEARRGLNFAKESDISRETVRENLRTRFLDVIQDDHDPVPYIHACASWSNVLIIGAISDKVVDTYWELERGLQHTWFYTYITDQFIDRELENISVNTPKRELEELDRMLNHMMYNINEYRGVSESTLSERDFRLYEALVETSRLNRLIDNVEEKASLLRERYNWLLQEKRTKVNKRIDFILFVIFIATLVGEYKAFLSLGVYLVPVVGIIVLIGGYLYTPFFRT